jgi:hypothetical protein
MSTMLEQAIVDAKALKEAAIKNAESALIEKYADSIRDAVDSLLEQEEEITEAEEDLGMDLGMDVGMEEPAPAADSIEAPTAVSGGENLCPCPEDEEEIVIDFDQLAAAVDAEEEAMEDDTVGSLDDLQSLGAPEDEEEIFAEAKEDEEEYNLDEVESIIGDLIDEVLNEEDDSADLDSVGSDKLKLDDEEEEEETVEEALTVDYDPQPNGTIGGRGITNNAEMEAERDAVLASQRDDERAEEADALKKTIEDLKESVKKMTDDQSKYVKVINHLKESVKKTNLSNAKLVYTNKILNSGSLNERQIEKIAEAISNANTVEEAKVIYETLQSAVESSRNKRNPKSLSEAISKRSPAFMPRHEKPAEANSETTRWKHLAGIK